MFERLSVLTDVLKHSGRDGADGRRRLRIGESRGWLLVQVAGFGADEGPGAASALGAGAGPASGAELGSVTGPDAGLGQTQSQTQGHGRTHGQGSGFHSAVPSILGVDLPARVGEVVRANGRRLLKTGVEQYWIITRDEDNILPGLQGAVTAQMGAITPLSHSRTCIFVEGDAARALLAKGVPLDFHPDSFRVDQFALTGLHHSPVLIHRSGEDRYELYVLRTYGLSVWEWITDAALPFGYEIVR